MEDAQAQQEEITLKTLYDQMMLIRNTQVFIGVQCDLIMEALGYDSEQFRKEYMDGLMNVIEEDKRNDRDSLSRDAGQDVQGPAAEDNRD